MSDQSYYAYDGFMTVSQYKMFRDCPACAMATIKGEWIRPKTEALLVGSYVDSILTDSPEEHVRFMEENHKRLFKRNGEPYAFLLKADDAVARVKRQPLAMKYLDGEHQTIMYGAIEGVPFKIKMDTYRPGEFISDLKYLASLRSPNLFESPIKYWGYDIQAACYQEIVRQNTGEKLPFFFVIATKEDPCKVRVAQISQADMDEALEEVKKNIGYYSEIREGKIPAEHCEQCDYCTETMIQEEIIDVNEIGMNRKQREYQKRYAVTEDKGIYGKENGYA